MLLPILLAVVYGSWVPARWESSDPGSLELLRGTPINCVLLEREHWSQAFIEHAARSGITTLGVVRRREPADTLRAWARKGLAGFVLEGDFTDASAASLREALAGEKAVVIPMPPRALLRFSGENIVATDQGVWPGVEAQPGAVVAGPTRAPWLNTNAGFLRYVLAAASVPVWLGNSPPGDRIVTVGEYLRAIAETEMAGARWVVALDADFSRRLFARQTQALKDWGKIASLLRYFEDHREWRLLRPAGSVVVVEQPATGALLSGGILDMIAVKNIPARTIPGSKLSAETLHGTSLLLDLDGSSGDALLTDFTQRGGTVLSRPPGAGMPVLSKEHFRVDPDRIHTLADLWRDVNAALGRAPVGIRLFNASSIVSELFGGANGKGFVLHLVNYSDYPIENLTVRWPDQPGEATLVAPGVASRKIEVYRAGGFAEAEIETISACATLLVK